MALPPLHIDPIIYRLQRFGGLSTVWDHLIPRFGSAGVPISFAGEGPFRRPPPPVGTFGSAPSGAVFQSTYFSSAPPGMRSVVLLSDLIYEDDPSVARLMEPGTDAIEIQRDCLARASAVVVPSRATARRALHHHPDLDGRIEVVHHGVDHLPPPPPDRAWPRPFVLHVGGRGFYKDFTTVLRGFALSSLRRTHDLVAVGSEPAARPDEEGPLSGSFRAQVHFLGHVAPRRLAQLYRDAAVLVSASRMEGFGLPVVEAASCGTPVACSDIGAYRELLPDCTEYFEPASVGDCADAMSRAADRAGAAAAAASAVRGRFGWDAAALKWLDVYADVAARRRS